MYIYIFCIFCKYKYYTHTIYNCAGCSFHKNLYVPRVQQQLHSGTTDSTEDPTFRPNSLCKSPLRHWSTSMSLTLHPDDSSQDNLAVSRNTCRSGRIAFRWVCMYISYIILYIYIYTITYTYCIDRETKKMMCSFISNPCTKLQLPISSTNHQFSQRFTFWAFEALEICCQAFKLSARSCSRDASLGVRGNHQWMFDRF